jgi:hypothetical protein
MRGQCFLLEEQDLLPGANPETPDYTLTTPMWEAMCKLQPTLAKFYSAQHVTGVMKKIGCVKERGTGSNGSANGWQWPDPATARANWDKAFGDHEWPDEAKSAWGADEEPKAVAHTEQDEEIPF